MLIVANLQGRLKLKGFRGTTQDTILRVTTKSSQGSGLAPPAPSWTGRSGGSQPGPSRPQCWWRGCPCYPSYHEARSEAWSVRTLLRGCVVTSCCGTPSQQLCKKDKFLIKISKTIILHTWLDAPWERLCMPDLGFEAVDWRDEGTHGFLPHCRPDHRPPETCDMPLSKEITLLICVWWKLTFNQSYNEIAEPNLAHSFDLIRAWL